MKALMLEKYNHLVYKDVPDPEILSNEVLIKVKACGIIVGTGKEIKGWKTGDRVTFDSTVYPSNTQRSTSNLWSISSKR